MTVASLTLAIGATARRSFIVPSSENAYPDWLQGPFGLLDAAPVFADGYSVLLLAMAACYLIVLACAGDLSVRWAIGTVVGLHVIFLLAPPLLTTDVFGYIGFGRVGAVHGLNPYEIGPGGIAGEPTAPYEVWHDLPSPYGPLFTALTYAVAPLGVAAGLWALKVAAAAASLGCVALVWAIAKRLGRDPLPAALFVGLNPLVLVHVVGGAHNDVFMVLPLLAGVYLAVAGRERLGAAAMVCAAAVKTTAAVALPFLVISSDERRRLLAAILGAALALGVLVLAVIGPGVADFPAALGKQDDLVSSHSLPHYLGSALGLGGATAGIKLAANLVLAGVLLLLAVRVWRGMDWIAAAGWATLALLLTTVWLMPWYVLWLLPLAALTPSRWLRGAALALTLLIVITRVPLLLG
ncbi:MAG: polyprenol phosphomannose-dependent alpha 1,6 mannosyltransferase MptB [Thermoleophilaceae bacterium]